MCPFALVRNCKFQSTYPSLGSLSDFKIFKAGTACLAACRHTDVHRLRARAGLSCNVEQVCLVRRWRSSMPDALGGSTGDATRP